MASTNDLKNGMVLNLDGQLWSVVEFQHDKPGKGGAFVRTTLKNVVSGKVVDKTFNAGIKVEIANVDKRTCSTSTRTARLRLHGHRNVRPDRRPAGDRRRRHELPAREPRRSSRPTRAAALHRAAGLRRAARGVHRAGPAGRPLDRRHQAGDARDRHEIQVPLFITTGEKIKVDTRDGRYLGRACSS